MRTIAEQHRKLWEASEDYHAEALRRALPENEHRQRLQRDACRRVIAAIQDYEAIVDAHRAGDPLIDRAETIARALFPDDYHDGTDCRAEIGREGQPCNACASRRDAWASRVASVHAAITKADPAQ